MVHWIGWIIGIIVVIALYVVFKDLSATSVVDEEDQTANEYDVYESGSESLSQGGKYGEPEEDK